VDAVASSLVARRHDDPLADDQGRATESGIVALLDRRKEGVGVGVEDRRQIGIA
jgi:hypothetical protein